MRMPTLSNPLMRACGAAALAAMLAAAAPLARNGARPENGVQLREGEVVVTDLGGDSHATTYWVDQPEGYRVVTMVETAPGEASRRAGAQHHSVVQFSMVLWPGQTQTITVPGPSLPTISIRRDGDRVQIRSSGCDAQS